jgi:hypothetical protein
VIFNYQVAPGRNAAVLAGWNDAAWGRPHRDLKKVQVAWYDHGYAGGLIFRQKRQSARSDRTVVSNPLPRVAPAS